MVGVLRGLTLPSARRTFRLVALLLLTLAGAVSLLSPPILYAQAPVQVALVDEGLDSAGRWFQRIRVTIGPGGSLTLASEELYGDQLHADDLFALAKRSNPGLDSPSKVPAGQELILTVDPRATHIIRERRVDQARQTRRIVYMNGVQRTIYLGARTGLLQEIAFPDDRPARSFVYADEQGRFTVPAGGRLLDYAYAGAEQFNDLVAQLYGTASVRAMQDFVAQTGWDPNRWPPPREERRRLALGPSDQYREVRPVPPSLETIPAERRAVLEQQVAERARLGLFAIAFDGTRFTYRALVTDAAVTARRAAVALYGDEARWLAIAKAAGLEVDEDHVKGLPPGTDPTLLGRSFELTVDLADEYFPVGQEGRAGAGRTITLRNGTTVEEYGPARPLGSGVVRIVRYPSGFKRIVYRPDPLWLFALDFVHFQAAFLRGAAQDETVRDGEGRAFTAQVLWLALRDLPRERDDVPVSSTIAEVERAKVLEVVTRPRAPEAGTPTPWETWWREQPVVITGAATLGAALTLLILFGLLRRSVSASAARVPLARRRFTRR